MRLLVYLVLDIWYWMAPSLAAFEIQSLTLSLCRLQFFCCSSICKFCTQLRTHATLYTLQTKVYVPLVLCNFVHNFANLAHNVETFKEKMIFFAIKISSIITCFLTLLVLICLYRQVGRPNFFYFPPSQVKNGCKLVKK